MKIGFISREDTNDQKQLLRAFSGIIGFFLGELKRQGHTIVPIGPIIPDLTIKFVGKLIGLGNMFNRIRGIQAPLMSQYHPYILDRFAKQIQEKLKQHSDLDFILCQDATIMSHVKTNIPWAIWRDANFADLLPYGYQNMNPISQKWAHASERILMNTATLNIFSSECSLNTSNEYYGIPKEQIAIIPFGPNHTFDTNEAYIKTCIENRITDSVCHLLFIGVEWQRKGGDKALEVCKILNDQGITCTIDLVGCNFEHPYAKLPYVTMHGFINKQTEEGREQFKNLLENATFLIHPTTAEAYGCLLVEAAAFGIPALTSNVGGIPTIIRQKENGVLFDLNALPNEYAQQIAILVNTKEIYRKMALNAYNRYTEKLNYTTAIHTLINEMKGRIK